MNEKNEDFWSFKKEFGQIRKTRNQSFKCVAATHLFKKKLKTRFFNTFALTTTLRNI